MNKVIMGICVIAWILIRVLVVINNTFNSVPVSVELYSIDTFCVLMFVYAYYNNGGLD